MCVVLCLLCLCETTELGGDDLNILSNLSGMPSCVSHRHSTAPPTGWQKALDPPRRFCMVAPSLWPAAFLVHSGELWLHPPWVWQYMFVIRRLKVASSGVRVFLLRLLSPRPPLLLLPPRPARPLEADCICCRMRSISNWMF